VTCLITAQTFIEEVHIQHTKVSYTAAPAVGR